MNFSTAHNYNRYYLAHDKSRAVFDLPQAVTDVTGFSILSVGIPNEFVSIPHDFDFILSFGNASAKQLPTGVTTEQGVASWAGDFTSSNGHVRPTLGFAMSLLNGAFRKSRKEKPYYSFTLPAVAVADTIATGTGSSAIQMTRFTLAIDESTRLIRPGDFIFNEFTKTWNVISQKIVDGNDYKFFLSWPSAYTTNAPNAFLHWKIGQTVSLYRTSGILGYEDASASSPFASGYREVQGGSAYAADCGGTAADPFVCTFPRGQYTIQSVLDRLNDQFAAYKVKRAASADAASDTYLKNRWTNLDMKFELCEDGRIALTTVSAGFVDDPSPVFDTISASTGDLHGALVHRSDVLTTTRGDGTIAGGLDFIPIFHMSPTNAIDAARTLGIRDQTLRINSAFNAIANTISNGVYWDEQGGVDNATSYTSQYGIPRYTDPVGFFDDTKTDFGWQKVTLKTNDATRYAWPFGKAQQIKNLRRVIMSSIVLAPDNQSFQEDFPFAVNQIILENSAGAGDLISQQNVAGQVVRRFATPRTLRSIDFSLQQEYLQEIALGNTVRTIEASSLTSDWFMELVLYRQTLKIYPYLLPPDMQDGSPASENDIDAILRGDLNIAPPQSRQIIGNINPQATTYTLGPYAFYHQG